MSLCFNYTVSVPWFFFLLYPFEFDAIKDAKLTECVLYSNGRMEIFLDRLSISSAIHRSKVLVYIIKILELSLLEY